MTPDDEDDEDEDDKRDRTGQTNEGDLLKALVNLQLKPRIKPYLPTYKQIFTEAIGNATVLHCYGIHLGVPIVQFFEGGFLLEGIFLKTPVNDSTCLGIEASGFDFITHTIAP